MPRACHAGASVRWKSTGNYRQTAHGDFLESTRETLGVNRWKPETTIIVGNPPFGRNGHLARAFLNKAAEYAAWILFVLPRSMHGAHGCGPVNPRLELVYERQLDGGFETTEAKCNWQEWFLMPAGCSALRPTAIAADPEGLYSIVTVDDDYNIIVQRRARPPGKWPPATDGTGQVLHPQPYPEVREAFQNLGKHEEADLTTHQLNLSTRHLDELLKRQLLSQYILNIKGAT